MNKWLSRIFSRQGLFAFVGFLPAVFLGSPHAQALSVEEQLNKQEYQRITGGVVAGGVQQAPIASPGNTTKQLNLQEWQKHQGGGQQTPVQQSGAGTSAVQPQATPTELYPGATQTLANQTVEPASNSNAAPAPVDQRYLWDQATNTINVLDPSVRDWAENLRLTQKYNVTYVVADGSPPAGAPAAGTPAPANPAPTVDQRYFFDQDTNTIDVLDSSVSSWAENLRITKGYNVTYVVTNGSQPAAAPAAGTPAPANPAPVAASQGRGQQARNNAARTFTEEPAQLHAHSLNGAGQPGGTLALNGSQPSMQLGVSVDFAQSNTAVLQSAHFAQADTVTVQPVNFDQADNLIAQPITDDGKSLIADDSGKGKPAQALKAAKREILAQALAGDFGALQQEGIKYKNGLLQQRVRLVSLNGQSAIQIRQNYGKEEVNTATITLDDLKGKGQLKGLANDVARVLMAYAENGTGKVGLWGKITVNRPRTLVAKVAGVQPVNA